jgi:uncharacterized protein (DUF58 family)
MSLRQNALILILLTGLFGIVEIWSAPPDMGRLWALPAALLLLGLAYEAAMLNRCVVELELQAPEYWPLARSQPVQFKFRQHSRRRLSIQAVVSAPDEFASTPRIETLQLTSGVATVVTLSSAPRRLGRYPWPQPTIRVGGTLRLAWWSRKVVADCSVSGAAARLIRDTGGGRGGCRNPSRTATRLRPSPPDIGASSTLLGAQLFESCANFS